MELDAIRKKKKSFLVILVQANYVGIFFDKVLKKDVL